MINDNEQQQYPNSKPESEELNDTRAELKRFSENHKDMETVLSLITHIDNPCGIKTSEGNKYDLRDFYLRLADEILHKLTNPYAKELLEIKIKQYKK